MNVLLGRGFTGFYEMGTGTTLSNLLKNIVSSNKSTHHITTIDKNNVEIVTISV